MIQRQTSHSSHIKEDLFCQQELHFLFVPFPKWHFPQSSTEPFSRFGVLKKGNFSTHFFFLRIECDQPEKKTFILSKPICNLWIWNLGFWIKRHYFKIWIFLSSKKFRKIFSEKIDKKFFGKIGLKNFPQETSKKIFFPFFIKIWGENCLGFIQ